MTAQQFLDYFDRGETNFSEFGKVRITEPVNFGKRTVKTEVDLGELIFEKGFNCGFSTFLEPFHFNEAIFWSNFSANQAVFGSFVVAEAATFNGPFDLCEAKLRRGLSLGESTFNFPFLGNEASIEGSLSFDESEFNARVLCMNLKVDLLECVRAHFKLGFYCGLMEVKELFDFGLATFTGAGERYVSFSCDKVKILGKIAIENPELEAVSVVDTPSLGWVIREYLSHNLRFNSLYHAPPHMWSDWQMKEE